MKSQAIKKNKYNPQTQRESKPKNKKINCENKQKNSQREPGCQDRELEW